MIEEHRKGQNPIHDFLAENAVQEEDRLIRIQDIRQRFARWNGKSVLSGRVLALLKSAGLDLVETSSGKAVRGWSWRTTTVPG
jgi:hypothetical protein